MVILLRGILSAIIHKNFVFCINSLVGLKINTKVSVFADITGECKKGSIKPYASGRKVYLGNGIVRQTRKQLFGKTAENPW